MSGHTVIRLVAAEPDLEALPISPSYHWWQSGIKPPVTLVSSPIAVWRAAPLQSLPSFSSKTNPRCA